MRAFNQSKRHILGSGNSVRSFDSAHFDDDNSAANNHESNSNKQNLRSARPKIVTSGSRLFVQRHSISPSQSPLAASERDCRSSLQHLSPMNSANKVRPFFPDDFDDDSSSIPNITRYVSFGQNAGSEVSKAPKVLEAVEESKEESASNKISLQQIFQTFSLFGMFKKKKGPITADKDNVPSLAIQPAQGKNSVRKSSEDNVASSRKGSLESPADRSRSNSGASIPSGRSSYDANAVISSTVAKDYIKHMSHAVERHKSGYFQEGQLFNENMRAISGLRSSGQFRSSVRHNSDLRSSIRLYSETSPQLRSSMNLNSEILRNDALAALTSSPNHSQRSFRENSTKPIRSVNTYRTEGDTKDCEDDDRIYCGRGALQIVDLI
jgi:hypothetical protein